ncbi:hypothetical protein U0070_012599, partial [Myodes glareolus]
IIDSRSWNRNKLNCVFTISPSIFSITEINFIKTIINIKLPALTQYQILLFLVVETPCFINTYSDSLATQRCISFFSLTSESSHTLLPTIQILSFMTHIMWSIISTVSYQKCCFYHYSWIYTLISPIYRLHFT